MLNFLSWLFYSQGYDPHGSCYLWQPRLIALHVSSDMLIGLSYVAISVMLVYLVVKTRQAIPFHWMVLAFGAFIIACGSTHFLEIVTLWTPIYWFSGSVKALTAVASVTTAVAMPRLLPKAVVLVETAQLSDQHKAQLETANAQLLEALDEQKKSEEALRASEERYRGIVETAQEGIWMIDAEGATTFVNRHTATLLGYSVEEMLRRPLMTFLDGNGTALVGQMTGHHQDVAGQRDIKLRRKDGADLWVLLSTSPFTDAAGHSAGTLIMVTDITARKQAERILEQHAVLMAQQARLLDLAHDAIIVRDLATDQIRFWNHGAEEMYGWTALQAVGQVEHALLQTHFPQPVALITDSVVQTGRWDGEVVHRTRDDQRLVVASRWALQRSEEGPSAVLEINTDVTARKQMEDSLRTQALHDALTGLPNRLLLADRTEQALRSVRRGHTPLALLLLDLNGFKEVNDTYGHHVGDALLVEVSGRLGSAVRASDTVARLGGDEFALLLPETDRTGAVNTAEKIKVALEAPIMIAEQVVQVSASVGIALVPEHGDDITLLLRRADIAMYSAKRSHRGMVVYDPQHDEYSPDRLARVADLRHAITVGALDVYYQPVIALTTGRSTHMEALVRWPHPRQGILQPGDFIPMAESTGLILPLTYWVLTTALEQCAAWRRVGLDVGVAVNLSMAAVHDPALPEIIAARLVATGVPPECLHLELTESVVMTDVVRTLGALARLHETGVQLSIDDFGTGYSSLAQLKRLPVDEVKIDRSFVREMTLETADAAVVRATTDLSHALGLRVVAEGIEDGATLEAVRRLGCDGGQGYHVGRPQPVADLTTWLRANLGHEDIIAGVER